MRQKLDNRNQIMKQKEG